MEPIRILLFRAESDDIAPADQALGARLASLAGSACSDVVIEEDDFRRGDLGHMATKLALWKENVSGVVGATNVPESSRLGELAEQMSLLCFVANNNPKVWQHRKHIFHIGLPSTQTAAAVAMLLQKTRRRRILLIYEETAFQLRLASSIEAALRDHHMEVKSQADLADSDFELVQEWQPNLVYLIFSSERKALPLAHKIRQQLSLVPLLFGRSLLRESFLSSLGDEVGEAWFVDMLRRSTTPMPTEKHFMEILSTHGVNVPTANHAFGWDAMSFCALGLKAGRGQPSRAINYLESSGVAFQGVTGTCSFGPDNHNGRTGFGPTTLTRWYKGHLEEI